MWKTEDKVSITLWMGHPFRLHVWAPPPPRAPVGSRLLYVCACALISLSVCSCFLLPLAALGLPGSAQASRAAQHGVWSDWAQCLRQEG